MIAIPLAAFGFLNPLIAAAAMALSSGCVVWNSSRLRHFSTDVIRKDRPGSQTRIRSGRSVTHLPITPPVSTPARTMNTGRRGPDLTTCRPTLNTTCCSSTGRSSTEDGRCGLVSWLLERCSSLPPRSSQPAQRVSNTSATIVRVVRTSSGAVLGTGSGLTLYVFVDDLLTKAPSACTGDCAHDWVPLPAVGRITVRTGVTGRMGTIVRSGGERQLTMDGRPLYEFSGDRASR